jgi:CDP-diglyceride synthetase
MLDRVDGLVAVATAIAAFALLVGESPLAGS